MKNNRKIVHVDMDAFYASVEQLDNPELKGKSVIVGGRPDSRGVVAACSYEARHYGIHSAMPCSRAYRLCPEALFITPRMNRYREVSSVIHGIFHQYTDAVEPLSLDEAFLDITENKVRQLSATLLAHEICDRIFSETGLSASAGVSCNKFVAKVASDIKKPRGITVIEPHRVLDFISGLPIGKFYGVGKVTQQKMLRLGIKTGADLRARTREDLIEHFGKHGLFYFDIVRGIDRRSVQPNRIRKSIGAEHTLKTDIDDRDEMLGILKQITHRISQSLEKKNSGCRTITLKVRYSDFTTITRSITCSNTLHHHTDLFTLVPKLLSSTEAGYRKVRLLGLSVSSLVDFDHNIPRQLRLPFMD